MSGPLSVNALVISGPSGVGKGTLIAALMQRVHGVHFAISATTRPPRSSERHGREYYFWDDAQFDVAEADGRLVESARYGAHRYGTLIDELVIAPHTLVECDVRGVEQLRFLLPAARYVFVAPPGIDELRRRLIARGTENEQETAQRLRRVSAEVAVAASLYDVTILNDDLGRAVDELVSVLQEAITNRADR